MKCKLCKRRVWFYPWWTLPHIINGSPVALHDKCFMKWFFNKDFLDVEL